MFGGCAAATLPVATEAGAPAQQTFRAKMLLLPLLLPSRKEGWSLELSIPLLHCTLDKIFLFAFVVSSAGGERERNRKREIAS